MATYALIHGAGSDAWYWHLVVPELRELGHDAITMDLPCDDDSAGLSEYTGFLLCRDDRFFPADFQRRVVRERLGLVPDEMDGGHLPALAHLQELVGRLEAYRTELLKP